MNIWVFIFGWYLPALLVGIVLVKTSIFNIDFKDCWSNKITVGELIFVMIMSTMGWIMVVAILIVYFIESGLFKKELF